MADTSAWKPVDQSAWKPVPEVTAPNPGAMPPVGQRLAPPGTQQRKAQNVTNAALPPEQQAGNAILPRAGKGLLHQVPLAGGLAATALAGPEVGIPARIGLSALGSGLGSLTEHGLGRATGVTPAKPTGDILAHAGSDAFTQGVVPEAGGQILGAIGPPLARAASSVYQGALKPPAKLGLDRIKSLVNTGLTERIPVNEGGLNKLENTVGDLNTQVGHHINASTIQIDPKAVATRISGIRPTFEQQVNPESDLNALSKTGNEFMQKHTVQAPFTPFNPYFGGAAGPVGSGRNPIIQSLSAPEAQAEKVGTYRQLNRKYGELGSADVEGQKALARGLREELSAGIPAIAPLNAREGKLLDLQEPLERSVIRSGNAATVPVGGTTVSIARKVLDSPGLKSNAAILMNRASGLPLKSAGRSLGIAAAQRNR